jgi:hypothetical protein
MGASLNKDEVVSAGFALPISTTVLAVNFNPN